MADFPYTPNPASLKRFFGHVQSAGIPSGVTLRYIESVGFKSRNDRSILAVLKAIKFVTESGSTTDLWQGYRNKENAPSVMATALRTAYSDLFATYPDAHRKDNEALRNYFSTHTKVGEVVLNLIVRTFKTLCELADFDAATTPEPTERVPAAPPARNDSPPRGKPSAQSGMTVNINIQLQLQATDDASVYEKFFSAMKKHLFPE